MLVSTYFRARIEQVIVLLEIIMSVGHWNYGFCLVY